MKPPLLPRRSARGILAALVFAAVLLPSPAALQAAPDDRGMIGIRFRQIYADQQPDHRGPLVVLRVTEDSPAAKAGIQCSDFVIAVDGTPVPGRDFSEIMKTIGGPIGSAVRLTILRSDGSQSTISLVRTPYPPHVNPASDPFATAFPEAGPPIRAIRFPCPGRRRSPTTASRISSTCRTSMTPALRNITRISSSSGWKGRSRSTRAGCNPTC